MKKLLLVFIFAASFFSAQKSLCPGIEKTDDEGYIFYSTSLRTKSSNYKVMPVNLMMTDRNTMYLTIINKEAKSYRDGFALTFDDDSRWEKMREQFRTKKKFDEYDHTISYDLSDDDIKLLIEKTISKIDIGDFEVILDKDDALKFQRSLKCYFSQ